MKEIRRCVNIDWLEVYCLENPRRYPCDVEYFRSHGYWVKERDYGTRVYQQMFTILDDRGDPFVEVRRCPPSGVSDFKGLQPESCHLRLVNAYCYRNDAVTILIDFMLKHEYLFQRIYRIDICNDFKEFDKGDKPARFAQRYIEKKYSKVNQCRLNVHGNDGWASFDWETLSWGSPSSMVTTKLYNKSKELAANGNKKSYIRHAWFNAGLIDSPLSEDEVWRVEFSLKSHIAGLVEIEDVSGKKIKKRKIPHNLSLYDSRDKLWRRFEELAYHYFHFKVVERVKQVNSLAGIALSKVHVDTDLPLKRKDLCPDKVLFSMGARSVFYQVEGTPSPASSIKDEEILKRRLLVYKCCHADMKIREACDVILNEIERKELLNYTPNRTRVELDALILAIRTRLNVPLEDATAVAKQTMELIKEKEIF